MIFSGIPAASVRDYVRQACGLENNIFGPSFFTEHLAVVAECAARLARPLRADSNIVELAAYLHDFSAACDPATLPNHANASANLATPLLNERGYPQTVITSVADAIVWHSQLLQIGAASPEAVCLSNADAAARMMRPAYWLYFAFRVRGQAFEEGRQWLLSLLETQWRNLIGPAKELVAGHYDRAVLVLGGSEDECTYYRRVAAPTT